MTSAGSKFIESSGKPRCVTAQSRDVQHGYLPLRDGSTLHYVQMNAKAADPVTPPVFFVHGWPDLWFGWRYQMPALADAGYRVIAIDNRGFGETKVSEETNRNRSAYTLQMVCDDITELLDFLKIRQVVLVGHDWGGAVVWRMARYKPDRVAAVAGICTPFRPAKSQFMSNAAIAAVQPQFWYQVYFERDGGKVAARELDSDPRRAVTAMLRSTQPEEHIGSFPKNAAATSLLQTFPKVVPKSKILTDEELDVYVAAFTKSGFFGSLQWYNTADLNWQAERTLPQTVSQPALMITAEMDRVLQPVMTAGMEQWVPKLSRASIADASHWVAFEQPAALNAVLLKWLREVAPVSASPKHQSRSRL